MSDTAQSNRLLGVLVTMTKSFLLDMDGVLVDSGDFHYQSWFETLARYDTPFTEENFRAMPRRPPRWASPPTCASG